MFGRTEFYHVAIEYEGELAGPNRHIASSPEIFRVAARSRREARREAVRAWVEKYRASSGIITAVRVAGPGEKL